MTAGLDTIRKLKDPVGAIMASWRRPNGMRIERVRVPLGVIGVIYESRPNVTTDAGALCLKAGNAVILRGGSESFRSARAIHAVSYTHQMCIRDSLLTERKITDRTTGELIATVTQTIFCRGDGGFGGPPRQTPAPHPIPTRAPDAICDLGTRPEMALIYRLSGDYNPLHAEPAAAKAAGFARPILHGLGTFGVSGHALLKTACGYDPARLVSFSGRFSAPVFPGETIRTEMWRDGAVMSFRARVFERNVVAIDHGRAEVRP